MDSMYKSLLEVISVAEYSAERRKAVRRISYSWGAVEASRLQKRIVDEGLADKLVAVHLSDLTAGLRLGTARFFEDVASDAALQERILKKSQLFYSSFGADAISSNDEEP
jgi:hypothetical protein